MKYGVKNFKDGGIDESTKTDNYEGALHTARSLARWNIECEVIDLETGKSLKHLDPYTK